MVKALLTGLALSLLAGCATVPEDYQVGDASRRALALQDSYCNGGNLLAKHALLLSLQLAVPGYPEDGVCTNFTQALLNHLETPATR